MGAPEPGRFLDPKAWLRRLIQATLRPRPKTRLWEWLERWVSIPVESGSPNPGPLRLSRFPIFRGLYDLVQQPGVHFVTLCASARVGKTLFSICIVLWWIAEKFGQIVWLDPTKTSALRLVRSELDQFLLQCPPVKALAIVTKTMWTALSKQFRGKVLRIVPSGAEADLHGFQAELAVINESDRCHRSIDRDATSADKIIARTRQFAHTRLILKNSTPTEELGDVWQDFLRGSQHYCYLPCPHCEKYQRLTFFAETKEVPFDEELRPLSNGATREERTGWIRFDQFSIYETRLSPDDATQTEQVKVGYDVDEVEKGATYVCAYCKRDIEWCAINGMLTRYKWVAHNPKAPRDRISAHLSALYSPFEFWGIIAKEFLESKGSLARMIKFETLTLGRPFIRYRTAVKESDIDKVIARSPRYLQGQIPMEPEILTMTADIQGEQLYYVIRAWGIQWDHPDKPTWCALVDWGEAINWDQLEEFCGWRPRADGTLRKFRFTRPDGTVREYIVTSGLVDSGYEAKQGKEVYEFCLKHAEMLSPYKGSDRSKVRGDTVRTTPILNGKLELILAWSDYFAAALYYNAIRDGRNGVGDLINWWLPYNADPQYKAQLTNERQVEENGKLTWKDSGNNHLGDCEKMQEVLRDTIEAMLDEIRAEKPLEEAA